jgi:hypothetical protein
MMRGKGEVMAEPPATKSQTEVKTKMRRPLKTTIEMWNMQRASSDSNVGDCGGREREKVKGTEEDATASKKEGESPTVGTVAAATGVAIWRRGPSNAWTR